MVLDTLLSESKANSVDICIHINTKIVQYKYKDSVCVCVHAQLKMGSKFRMSVCVWCARAREPVLGQDGGEGVRGEAFYPRPRGRERCKTRAPAACCGNAG